MEQDVYKKAERIHTLADGSVLIYYADEAPRRLNVRPYFEKGVFKALQDPPTFREAELDVFGGIVWSVGDPDAGGGVVQIDLSPETVRLSSDVIDPVEAEKLVVRDALLWPLMRYIAERGLSQRSAAGELGIHQPRVSLLMQGQIEAFSIDALVELLARIGLHVEVALSHAA